MLDALAAFHFLRPLWLLAIVPSVAAYLALRRQGKTERAWRKVIAPHLLPHLVVNSESDRWLSATRWALPVTTLAAVTMAGPTWRLADDPSRPDDSRLVIVVELSSAMKADDVGPSRIARARLKLRDLLQQRAGGKVGLIAVAGSAHLVMPMTDDPSVVIPYLDALDPQLMPQDGTLVERALPLVHKLLEPEPADRGEPTEQQASERGVPATVVYVGASMPPAAADALAELTRTSQVAVVALTVGTDSPKAGMPPLDRTGFERLARRADATVVPLSLGQSDLRALRGVLERQQLKRVNPDDASQWEDAGYALVFPLALLLCLWFRRGWVIGRASLAALVLLLNGCSGTGFWGLWFTPDQRGRFYLERGDFPRAAECFADPMWKGAAYYAAGDWDHAAEQFGQVASPEGSFNLGNAKAQGRDLGSALAAYEQALELRPTFRRARHNRDLLQTMTGSMTESDSAEDDAKEDATQEPEDAKRVQLKKGRIERQNRDKPKPKRSAASGDPLGEAARERWMQQVSTKPADFLRQKFAYEASAPAEGQ